MALDLAFAETVRRRGILRTNILVMDEVLYVCMYVCMHCMYVCMHVCIYCMYVYLCIIFKILDISNACAPT